MRIAPLPLLLAVAACAPAPPLVPAAPPAAAAPAPSPARDESFRAHAPVPEPPHPFVFPAVVRRRLKNGVPVVVTRQPSPFVTVQITSAGGVLDVGADQVDVLDAMARTFRAGTEKLSYADLHDVLSSLTMPDPVASWGWDSATISGVVPVSRLRAGIAVLADLALRPSFDEKNFEAWRDRAAIALEQQRDSAVAGRVLHRVLFGGHPYGAVLTPVRTRAVKRADVVTLHARLFDPSRLLVSVAGGAEVDAVVEALDDAFDFRASPAKPGAAPGPAPKKGAPPGKAGAAPPALPVVPSGPRLVVVDQPGSTIATIAMGAVGPAYGSADVGASWIVLDLCADGAFGRITTQLRDQLGDVPRVSSSYAWMRLGGVISWQVRAPTERVGPVLTEADRILRELAARGPAEEELADVKGRRSLAYVSWFETTGGTARELALSALYQQSDDALVSFPDRFAAVSASDARVAAARYLDPARVRTVIVGDWARLQPSLAALGWGPVELRTADADVVSAGQAAGHP